MNPDLHSEKALIAGLIETLDLLAAQARAYERALPANNDPARVAVATLGELARQAMNEEALLAALGPLATLYTDPDVLEIMVDAPDDVYFYRDGKLEDSDAQFESVGSLRRTIDTVLSLNGIQLGQQRTTAEIRFPDGSRFVAIIPPTAVSGPTLVIRKFSRRKLTWEQLIEWGSITQKCRDLFQSAIHAHNNILMAGGAGSGKTTVANLVAGLIPGTERIVVAEIANEMQIDHPRRIYLESGGPENLTQAELLNTAARMRPDWLVTGELVGSEALQAVQLMGSGHNGLATIHANSAEDALTRLETMCLMANLGLSRLEIRALIASAIQLISYQQWIERQRRKITQMVELCGLENDRYVLRPLFRYNLETGVTEATGSGASWEA